MAFTTLVFFQLFNVFNARFDDRSAFHKLGRNRWLWLLLRATPQRARMTPLLSSSKESQGNPW